jgi:hypothetical protein
MGEHKVVAQSVARCANIAKSEFGVVVPARWGRSGALRSCPQSPSSAVSDRSYHWCVANVLDTRVHPRWALATLLLLLVATVAFARWVTPSAAFPFVAIAAGIEGGVIAVIDVALARTWIATAVAALLIVSMFSS